MIFKLNNIFGKFYLVSNFNKFHFVNLPGFPELKWPTTVNTSRFVHKTGYNGLDLRVFMYCTYNVFITD